MAEKKYNGRYESDYDHDKFDPRDRSTYPVLVISSTIDAGIEYAKVIGIENYIVAKSLDKIQGMFIRAVIVTPKYLMDAEKAYWEAMSGYQGSLQNLYHSAEPPVLG